jgi:hypothetical protein
MDTRPGNPKRGTLLLPAAETDARSIFSYLIILELRIIG